CHLREGLTAAMSNVVESSNAVKVFLVEHLMRERPAQGGPGACWDAIEVAVSEEPLRQDGEGNAPDAFSLQDVEEVVFDPAIEHRVRRLMDEQRGAQLVEDGDCFGGALVRIGRDADVEGLPGGDRGMEGTDRFLQGRL